MTLLVSHQPLQFLKMLIIWTRSIGKMGFDLAQKVLEITPRSMTRSVNALQQKVFSTKDKDFVALLANFTIQHLTTRATQSMATKQRLDLDLRMTT